MDLTSLSSTLPRNASASDDVDHEEPASVVMSAFKQAALSVTNLYRTAAEQADRSRKSGRAEGYNDCLEDLLALLSRIEQRTDPKTTEVVRQWALSKKRKSGFSQTQSRVPREHREDSMDSDTMMDPTHGSSSPPQQHPNEPTPPPAESTVDSFPQHIPALPQAQFFTFRPEHNIPLPSPAPETVNLDLPDNDVSPPGSPGRTPQHSFQPGGPFRGVHGNTNTGRNRHHWNHQQPRPGTKRRFSSMTDFLDVAGIPLEKLQGMGATKKGRYQ